MLEVGLRHTSELQVSYAVTAIQMGSGDLPVLSTPAMTALIESSHLRPTKVGDTVRAVAEVIKVDGKQITFHVTAFCGEDLIGGGIHIRYVVDKEKFMSRI